MEIGAKASSAARFKLRIIGGEHIALCFQKGGGQINHAGQSFANKVYGTGMKQHFRRRIHIAHHIIGIDHQQRRMQRRQNFIRTWRIARGEAQAAARDSQGV